MLLILCIDVAAFSFRQVVPMLGPARWLVALLSVLLL